MDEKYKLLGNFEKTLKFFVKNSLEKLHFYLFLEKLLLKIEPSEITSFFYNNFFNFGGGRSLCFPLAAPMIGEFWGGGEYFTLSLATPMEIYFFIFVWLLTVEYVANGFTKWVCCQHSFENRVKYTILLFFHKKIQKIQTQWSKFKNNIFIFSA